MSKERIIALVILAVTACIAFALLASRSSKQPVENSQVRIPVSWACTLNTSSYGWTAEFTNPNASDITITSYDVLFFDTSGQETGYTQAVNTPVIVAANSSYSDVESHSFSAPIPDNSNTCRLANMHGQEG